MKLFSLLGLLLIFTFVSIGMGPLTLYNAGKHDTKEVQVGEFGAYADHILHVAVASKRKGRSKGYRVGAGVAIGERLFVTAWHVVASGGDIIVTNSKGKKFRGKVVAYDPTVDMALVWTSEKLSPVASLRKGDLKIGESIFVIGHHLGVLRWTFAFGRVMHPGRDLFSSKVSDINAPLIQLDMHIAPGASGGGLFDAAGNLVGIVVQLFDGVGIGLAVPIEVVCRFKLRETIELCAKGKVLKKTSSTDEKELR
ncbi:MAG: hypothetical protein BMS9Abin13_010 [Patescibacteria group bacterium]|nr:MAG: hypothetical protein BMS9Abin13_010 [Patescibacteria group bacterium]